MRSPISRSGRLTHREGHRSAFAGNEPNLSNGLEHRLHGPVVAEHGRLEALNPKLTRALCQQPEDSLAKTEAVPVVDHEHRGFGDGWRVLQADKPSDRNRLPTVLVDR
jgi:hypothetical protein